MHTNALFAEKFSASVAGYSGVNEIVTDLAINSNGTGLYLSSTEFDFKVKLSIKLSLDTVHLLNPSLA